MASSLPVQDEPGPCCNEYEPSPTIEPQRFFHINHREARGSNQCNDFKDGLDPGRRLDVVAVTVGGTAKQYSTEAMSQDARMTSSKGLSLNARCPYQASAMNTLDAGR